MILHITAVSLFLSQVVFSEEIVRSPIVNIPELGLVRGNYSKSYFTERTLYEFYGINYAKPPSGDRRFRPPEAWEPWTGVYNATKMRQRCPQVELAYYPSPDQDKLDVKADIEDCLVINVFTPHINPNKEGLPVLFYIHGGAFHLGSAYDFLPDFLLEENIVLAVPQYRLGVLGTENRPEGDLNCISDVPGNMGMLDILLALRWVKTHIRSFGGDPSKITVVGQSAGAAAASSLLISPLVEQGLYDKMIIQSGSILGLWAVDDTPVKSARSIAKIAGCTTDDLDKMTACLKTVQPLDLVNAHMKFLGEDMTSGGKGIGGTSLVVQGRGPGKYLDKHPHEIFRTGSRIKVPIMGGTVRDEGTTFLASFYDLFKLAFKLDDRYFERNVTSDILAFFGFDDSNGILIDAFRNMYFGNRKIRFREMYAGLVDICGVLLMKQPTYNLLRSMSYSGKTYAYSFHFYGEVSKLRASEPDWDKQYPFPAGVGHSDDLGYLFPSVKHKYSRKELTLVKRMTKLWTNFIIHGTPVTPESPFPWPSMSGDYGPYLRIGESAKIRDNFLDEFTVAVREGFLPSCSSTHIPLIGILFAYIIAVVLFR